MKRGWRELASRWQALTSHVEVVVSSAIAAYSQKAWRVQMHTSIHVTLLIQARFWCSYVGVSSALMRGGADGIDAR